MSIKPTFLLFSLLFLSVLQVEAPAQDSPAVKITPLLKTTTSWDGRPIVYPKGQAEITGVIIEIAPGGQTGWHLHPVPCFGCIMEGELDVTLKDGRVKHMKAGEALAEVVNTLHNGRNTGKTPLKLLVFYAGAVGSSLTVKEPVKK